MKQNHQINLVASFKTPENQRKANVIIKNSLYFGFCLAGEKKKKGKDYFYDVHHQASIPSRSI